MHKKVFAAMFLLLILGAFAVSQIYSAKRDLGVFLAEDKESILESALGRDHILKEIYGMCNRVLSPKEKVNNRTAVIKSPDGYLQSVGNANVNVFNSAKNTIAELNEVCHQNGSEFLFVYYPSKSDSENVSTRYGIETNTEEVRAEFLDYLDEIGISCLDVRELLEQDGYTTRDIFYKTDHHWTTEAGLYAARAIADRLNRDYSWSLDTAALEKDRFTFTTYENLWLGEYGRGMSRTWVDTLDDFTQIMPNYETAITVDYPDGREETGDFAMLVDTSGYSGDVDYYKYSAHYSYAKGMDSLVTYHNDRMGKDGKKILLVHDSFSVVVLPFLLLETSEITVWDMRDEVAKEGLYQFIAENDFDAVLVAYTDFWKAEVWNFN